MEEQGRSAGSVDTERSSQARRVERVSLSALTDCYQQNYRNLFGLAVRIVGSPEIAEDILQQAFINANAAIKRNHEIANLEGWLKAIVRNLALSQITRSKPTVPLADHDLVDELGSPHRAAHMREHIGKLYETLDQMPAAQRSVFLLAEVHGADRSEIANALERSEIAVAGLLRRARACVRESFSTDELAVLIPVLRELDGQVAPDGHHTVTGRFSEQLSALRNWIVSQLDKSASLLPQLTEPVALTLAALLAALSLGGTDTPNRSTRSKTPQLSTAVADPAESVHPVNRQHSYLSKPDRSIGDRGPEYEQRQGEPDRSNAPTTELAPSERVTTAALRKPTRAANGSAPSKDLAKQQPASDTSDVEIFGASPNSTLTSDPTGVLELEVNRLEGPLLLSDEIARQNLRIAVRQKPEPAGPGSSWGATTVHVTIIGAENRWLQAGSYPIPGLTFDLNWQRKDATNRTVVSGDSEDFTNGGSAGSKVYGAAYVDTTGPIVVEVSATSSYIDSAGHRVTVRANSGAAGASQQLDVQPNRKRPQLATEGRGGLRLTTTSFSDDKLWQTDRLNVPYKTKLELNRQADGHECRDADGQTRFDRVALTTSMRSHRGTVISAPKPAPGSKISWSNDGTDVTGKADLGQLTAKNSELTLVSQTSRLGIVSALATDQIDIDTRVSYECSNQHQSEQTRHVIAVSETFKVTGGDPFGLEPIGHPVPAEEQADAVSSSASASELER